MDRQAFQGRAATALQSRLGGDARRQQRREPSEGMAGQHQARAVHRQPPQPLGGHHRLHIGQADAQGFGSRRWLLPIEGSPQGQPIAARVLHHHHRPAPLGQGPGQPAQLVGVSPQAWHHQHPGLVGAALHGGSPDLQRQAFAPARHRKLQPQRRRSGAARLGSGVLPGGGRRLDRRQGQAPQAHHRLLLALQLKAPALAQAHQGVEAEIQGLRRQCLQQHQQRDLPPLLQQPPQGDLQQGRGAAPIRRGEQVAQLLQQLPTGPGVEQLAAEALIPEQGGPQHPVQVGAAAGIEQAEPRPQITRQWPITCRLPAPIRQLVEVDRDLEGVDAQLQQLGRPQRLRRRQRQGHQADQQAAEDDPAATTRGGERRRAHPRPQPGFASLPQACSTVAIMRGLRGWTQPASRPPGAGARCRTPSRRNRDRCGSGDAPPSAR